MNSTKQVFGILISLILLVISCNKCQKLTSKNEAQPWDSNMEKQMANVFYTQAGNLTSNEKARRAFADCCLSKMKEVFPKGISSLGNEMTDSVKISIMQMGAECSGVLKHTLNIWEKDAESQLKLQLYALDEIKMLPPKMKKEYVDCIAFKITAEFPNGFNKNELKKFIDKARHECVKMIGRKYDVPKSKKTSR